MDRTTLERRLQAAEDLVQRMEQNIAFQGRMIATLDPRPGGFSSALSSA
jgi:hypothetical protein